MRIIAGKFRGIKLLSPKGKNTRPTADKARESLFNILDHGKFSKVIHDAKIVDIFAGTGALGLEAMSRGAKSAIFFEQDNDAIAALKSNINICKINNDCEINKTSALQPPQSNMAYDILFFDPPYYQELANKSLVIFNNKGWIDKNSLNIVQIHPKDQFTIPEGFELTDQRKYGAAKFLFITKTRDNY